MDILLCYNLFLLDCYKIFSPLNHLSEKVLEANSYHQNQQISTGVGLFLYIGPKILSLIWRVHMLCYKLLVQNISRYGFLVVFALYIRLNIFYKHVYSYLCTFTSCVKWLSNNKDFHKLLDLFVVHNSFC